MNNELLMTIANPLATTEDIENLGIQLGLGAEDVAFVKRWVSTGGVLWKSSEEMDVSYLDALRKLRNPKIREIINKGEELGLCLGTVMSKDEFLMDRTQVLRNEFLPEVLRSQAGDTIAKLQGYYADNKNNGGQVVQILINDPYSVVVDG